MPRHAATLIAAGLLSIATTAPAGAFSPYCNEPTAPYCASAGGPFADDSDYQSCLNSTQAYFTAVEQYYDCILQAVDAEQKRISDAMDVIVAKFNCRASGETYC